MFCDCGYFLTSYLLCFKVNTGITLVCSYFDSQFLCIPFEGYCPPPFRRKAEGHCFWLSVVRGAWCVARGAWCVARGAWFRIFSRYLVPLTPPTVFVLSF